MPPPAIPKNLLPLAKSLAALAAQNPKAAELVITIMTNTVDRALEYGALEYDVWLRSFEAASRQFAQRKWAREWTKAVPLRMKSAVAKFTKGKGDVEKAR